MTPDASHSPNSETASEVGREEDGVAKSLPEIVPEIEISAGKTDEGGETGGTERKKAVLNTRQAAEAVKTNMKKGKTRENESGTVGQERQTSSTRKRKGKQEHRSSQNAKSQE